MSYFVEVEGIDGKMVTFDIDQVVFYKEDNLINPDGLLYVVLNTKTDMLLKISYEAFNNVFNERLDWVAMKNREDYIRNKYRG